MRALALTIVLLAAAGCGNSNGAGNGTGGGGCDSEGVVYLSWTVHGQPPTADQGCTGIQSLTADLHSSCTEVEIEPIPCINGRMWRYDGLPGGRNIVDLYAFDAQLNIVASGEVDVTLANSVPAAPTPVDLE